MLSTLRPGHIDRLDIFIDNQGHFGKSSGEHLFTEGCDEDVVVRILDLDIRKSYMWTRDVGPVLHQYMHSDANKSAHSTESSF